MNVMFDTCVILDFLLDRQSFGDDRRSHCLIKTSCNDYTTNVYQENG